MKRKTLPLAKPAPHEIKRPALARVIEFEPPTPGEIAAIRERLGLSREGLATVVGVSRATPYLWERGRTAPTQAVMMLLRFLVDPEAGPVMRRRLGLAESKRLKPLGPSAA